jgi:6-phosphogluconolactonase
LVRHRPKSIPLSSVGFCQFISPSLQLLIGVFVFGEAFDSDRMVRFIFIWTALFLYALSYIDFSSLRSFKKFSKEGEWVSWTKQDFQRALSGHEPGRPFHVLLSGGSTPEPVYRGIASMNFDGRKIHLWVGDERFLPPGDRGRNETMIKRAFGINDDHGGSLSPFVFHGWSCEDSPERSAEKYSDELTAALGPEPSFDLVYLGIGIDGHTAGLFPGGPKAGLPPGLAAATTAPEEPRKRTTVSYDVLARARKVRFLVRGREKIEMALRAAKRDQSIPAGRVAAKDRRVLFCGE